jgi:hypothetical protein
VLDVLLLLLAAACCLLLLLHKAQFKSRALRTHCVGERKSSASGVCALHGRFSFWGVVPRPHGRVIYAILSRIFHKQLLLLIGLMMMIWRVEDQN